MDDDERIEGDEEMELDDASDGEDEDEEPTGIPRSPMTNTDQFLGPPTPSPSTSQFSSICKCTIFCIPFE